MQVESRRTGNTADMSLSPTTNYLPKVRYPTELSSWLILVGSDRDKSRHLLVCLNSLLPKSKRLASSKLGGAAAANELVQRRWPTFGKKRISTMKKKRRSDTWVYTVMRNRLLSLLRRLSGETTAHGDIWPIDAMVAESQSDQLPVWRPSNEPSARLSSNQHITQNNWKIMLKVIARATRPTTRCPAWNC